MQFDRHGTRIWGAVTSVLDRTTRYVKLLHLPDGRTAEHVRDALVHTFAGLPAELARSLTWDQGSEMSRHDEFTRATNVPLYFCEPASPWQRASNENTYWCSLGGPGFFDGRGSAGAPGDSENTCRKAFR